LILAIALCASPAVAQEPETEPSQSPLPSTQAAEPEPDSENSPEASRVEDGRHFYISAIGSYGWASSNIGNLDINAYTFGVGGRVGWTFDNGFYLGAAYNYFAGSEITEQYYGFAYTTTANTWNASLDLGYDLWLGPLITRYAMSVGVIHLNFDRLETGNSPRSTLQFSPVFSLLFPIDWFVIGVEAYFSFIPNGQIPSAVALNIPLGLRF